MPKEDLKLAISATKSCDVFLVLGSSLIVEPVASLPKIALENNAKLIIINKGVTPYDELAQISIKNEITSIADKFL